MSSSCTPILVGVVSLVSEIPQLSKTANFPFLTMESMVIKKFNLSELAQKFMQVGVDVTCMYIDYGGCGFFDFGDMATFQKRPNFPF